MARKPKPKSEQTRPEILRTVRMPNGDLYGPGEEEEFVEALEQAAKDAKAETKDREARGLQPTTFDPKEQIKRLTKAGFLVNFEGADADDDDEDEDITYDRKESRAVVRELSADQKRTKPTTEEDENPVEERVRARNKARRELDEEREAAEAPEREKSARKGTKRGKADEDEGGGGT